MTEEFSVSCRGLKCVLDIISSWKTDSQNEDSLPKIILSYIMCNAASNCPEQKSKCNNCTSIFQNIKQKLFARLCANLFFLNRFVTISVNEHFTCARKIHPPDRCSITRCWLNRRRRPWTVDFTERLFFNFGLRVTTVFLMQSDTSWSGRVDQVIDCNLWSAGAL